MTEASPAPGGAAVADPPVIEARNVAKYFSIGRDPLGRPRPPLKAVDGVSLAIRRGQTLALVGETGSGKTTFGRLLLSLYKPTSGDILYRGESILDRHSRAAQSVRRQVQGVFQDPFSSLNPTMTVGQSLAEVLSVHHVVARRDRSDRVAELLSTVGLSPAQASRRPHAFSGGERQRVGIARALAVEPEVVVADEPLSALDVSIQAQVLNLMIRLQDERGLTYLFVTHDLDVARHISQRTAVLYLGRVVEEAPTGAIFAEPLHPYTQALVRAAPRLSTQRKTTKPAGRRHPERDRAARGLPLPPALPAGHAGVPGARARAAADRRPLRGLPPARPGGHRRDGLVAAGEADQVVVADLPAQPRDVARAHRVQQGQVALHGVGQLMPWRSISARISAPIWLFSIDHRSRRRLPPGDADQLLVEPGIGLDQRVHVVGGGRGGHLLQRRLQRRGQLGLRRPARPFSKQASSSTYRA